MGLPLDPECLSSEFKKTYDDLSLKMFFICYKNLGLDPDWIRTDSATACIVYTGYGSVFRKIPGSRFSQYLQIRNKLKIKTA